MSSILRTNKAEVLKDRRRRSRNAPGFRSRRHDKLVEGLSRAELIKKYESKVRLIATRLSHNLPQSVDIDDLVSVGFIGLMDAADKFNENKGVKFSTYAEFRIRGAIIDELRNQDWVPHCARGQAKVIEKTYHQLERQTGRRPTETEVSTQLGLTRDHFQKLRDRLSSLTLVSYEEEPDLHQAADLSNEGNPFQATLRKTAREFLESLFLLLSQEEKTVLSCYYFRGLNLKEISEILEVTESRVSQIHTKAIFRLKEQLRRTGGGDSDSMFTLLLETT